MTTQLEEVGIFLFLPVAILLLHYLSLILHELGHLACAWVIGWKPTRLAIGVGRPLWTQQWGRLKITFGPDFCRGYVYAIPQERAWYGSKLFLFSAAGLVATTLVVAGLGWLVLHPRPFHEKAGLHAAFFIALLLEGSFLLSNLFPRIVQLDGRDVPSDGLSMWRTLSAPRQELDKQFAFALVAQAADRAPADPGAALTLLDRAATLLSYPDGYREFAKIYWLFPHNADAARAEWRRLEQMERLGEVEQAGILDGLACIPLFYGVPDLIPDALATIERAIARDPSSITLRGTKGSLLIETNEIEVGERMLEEVQAGSKSENDQAICTYYLALAQKKKGKGAEARRQLWAAQEKYPECLVALRIARTICGGEIDG